MPFTDPGFIFLFLPLFLLVYYIIHRALGINPANLFLLFAGLAFYALGERQYILLFICGIFFNYIIAILIEKARNTQFSNIPMFIGLAGNLSPLLFMKYSSIVVIVLNASFQRRPGFQDSFSPSSLHLPTGISFYTFLAIAYLVDVQRGTVKAERNPLKPALYISLFPQLLSGPISRFKLISAQISERSANAENFAEGARRFIIGLGKKLIIADTLSPTVNALFLTPTSELSPGIAWLGIIAYTIQIYFDFSGYTDMAIGIARMIGFQLPENFNYPYASRSISEFWRRWHISLSTWFRDYLYIPLGGNRRGAFRTYVNVMIVFGVCGLWHGASLSFVAWGLYHGLFIVIERMGLKKLLDKSPVFISRIYALFVIITGWAFFRAGSLEKAKAMFFAMAGAGRGAVVPYPLSLYLGKDFFLALAFGIVFSMPVMPAVSDFIKNRCGSLSVESSNSKTYLFATLNIICLLAILAVSASLIAAQTYTPFIYSKF